MIDRKEISHAFKNSHFGETLGANVRYEKYKPADISNEEWVALLGRDVSNLEHLALTRGIAELFVDYTKKAQPGLISNEEGDLLVLTAEVHDWGEAVTGDISYGDKSDDDDEVEKDAFSVVSSELFPDDAAKQALLQEARDVALNHSGGEINKMFHAIEVLGYFRTALRAVEVSNTNAPLSPELLEGLKWLTTDVFSNVSIKAMEYGTKYYAVHASLIEYASQIDQAFAHIYSTPDIYDKYGERSEEKRAAIQLAYDNWLMYRAEAHF